MAGSQPSSVWSKWASLGMPGHRPELVISLAGEQGVVLVRQPADPRGTIRVDRLTRAACGRPGHPLPIRWCRCQLLDPADRLQAGLPM